MSGIPDGELRTGRPRALLLLATLLFAEAAALGAATFFLTFELFTRVPDSYASAIGITVLSALAAVWLGAMAAHTLRGSPWIRGAAITVQLLQIAVAVGAFQGLFARPDIGWLLMIPAILVLVLLFTRSVLTATSRPEEP
ncbi:MAG TPA: hypothetical protein VGO99_01090 [Leifsonia sp.]|nr:putative integral rane protein [Microbacteriaceae bacterium]HEV7811526.1 hypothetical protein [Leifsonia sp.]